MPIERLKTPKGMRLHPLRALDLTASDIAASQGLDPFKSALQLYAEKTGQIDGAADNDAMRRGRWLEAAVIAAIIDEHPELRVRYPLELYFRDPELRLGCTPDAVAEHVDRFGLINIQCKVVARPVFERDWADGPPIGYQLQTLCEGMLMEAAVSTVAALVIDSYTAKLHMFPVERHLGAEAKIRAIAATFWDNVRSGKRPAADFSRDAETLAAMFPNSEPEPVLDLSGDNRLAELLPVRAMLRGERDALSAKVDEIDTEIKDKLGAAERATLPGWKIGWPTIHKPEHVVKASSYRRLSVSATKEQAA